MGSSRRRTLALRVRFRRSAGGAHALVLGGPPKMAHSGRAVWAVRRFAWDMPPFHGPERIGSVEASGGDDTNDTGQLAKGARPPAIEELGS